MTISVFIYCGDRLLRAGLSALLREQDGLDVVGETSDPCEAAPRARELRPDVVVASRVDHDTVTCKELAAVTKLVTFADLVTPEHVEEVLALKARAVLSPRGTPGELIHAIRAVASGDVVLLPLAIQPHIERMAQYSSTNEFAGSVAELTTREADVLGLLSQGLSNEDIAGTLFVSTATVRSHVHRMLRKLGVRNRTQAVALAYRAGLVPPILKL